jgi:hypothetical protein
VSILSLAIGYVLWLPNDYENLAETVIASTVFSNNILSGITTKNYWDAINEYKPLMHMWYVGILMEYYVRGTRLHPEGQEIQDKTESTAGGGEEEGNRYHFKTGHPGVHRGGLGRDPDKDWRDRGQDIGDNRP